MSMDFNDAESKDFGIIPVNTVAPMMLTIRPGAVGDGGWEASSDTSQYTWLDCEFVVTEGPYRNRKFWQKMMVSGPSEMAISITRSTLRGILESARKIDPKDESEAAKAKRIVSSYGDFSGLEFVGKIGIEKGKDGYEDKNKLLAAVPVTSKEYSGTSAAVAPAVSTPAPASTPAWAQ